MFSLMKVGDRNKPLFDEISHLHLHGYSAPRTKLEIINLPRVASSSGPTTANLHIGLNILNRALTHGHKCGCAQCLPCMNGMEKT